MTTRGGDRETHVRRHGGGNAEQGKGKRVSPGGAGARRRGQRRRYSPLEEEHVAAAAGGLPEEARARVGDGGVEVEGGAVARLAVEEVGVGEVGVGDVNELEVCGVGVSGERGGAEDEVR